MDIPYGFDCYAFSQNEVKFFESNIIEAKSAGVLSPNSRAQNVSYGGNLANFVKFARKNEDYTSEQLHALALAGRLSLNEISKQIFCGIKIQIGIGVVTNFLHKGMQYRRPNKGRSELINGTWNGIVSGLTVDRNAPNSYELAFGNFLAYDEEFPYIKFGPFFAIESKLVMLTGSSRRIEASSFGTNIQTSIWFTVLALMFILSLLASFRVHWQHTKHHAFEVAIRKLFDRYDSKKGARGQKTVPETTSSTESKISSKAASSEESLDPGEKSVAYMIHNFFFIYFTMMLNKPSLEFDDFIWPKHNAAILNNTRQRQRQVNRLESKEVYKLLDENEMLRKHYEEMVRGKKRRKPLPTSVRILSYLWSAACLVMASIYSGEMLAVILLHADQNIDTIQQLINAKPPIEPVIRQDDFTYNLMLKSLDNNMLLLHNKTKIIPRPEVYTRRFIESVSQRKQALLGDDELIETIYEIYHKYFPLYKSKITYLQYPISIMYRKDLNASLEVKLRRGMVQIFEMGLIHRWYQAQKETYIHFYDSYEKKESDKDKDVTASSAANSDQKYKPLSMHHFESFFRLMLLCILFAFLILGIEIVHSRISGGKSLAKTGWMVEKEAEKEMRNNYQYHIEMEPNRGS